MTPRPRLPQGIAIRMATVVACGFIPILAFFVYWIEVERRAAHHEAVAWTRDVAAEIAAGHASLMLQFRHTLEMVAVSRAVTGASSAECRDLLLEVRERRSWMRRAWVVGGDGRTICATDPGADPPVLDDERSNGFGKDGFLITDLRGGEPSAHHLVAALTFGEAQDPHRVLVETQIDIGSLLQFHAPVKSRDGAVAVTLDRRGRIMAHTAEDPQLIGQPMPVESAFRSLIGAIDTTLVGALHGGDEYVLSAARVPEWESVVVVGISRDRVLAASRRDLAAGLGVLLFVFVMTGGMTWASATQLILRPIRAVRDTALAMAQGNFGRRLLKLRGPREVQEMATAFNTMADKLEGLALTDGLTGLANRHALALALRKLAADPRPFAVVSIDLDEFKPINDRFGHAAGDEALRVVAARLNECVAGAEICARVGGDEFVAIFSGTDATLLRLRAMAVGERIRAAIAAPIDFGHVKASVFCSVGVAIRRPEMGTDADIIGDADRSLYAAKAAGRNRIAIFEQVDSAANPEIRGSGPPKESAA